MLRWVVFASAVWSCVSLCASDPVGAFICMHAAAVRWSRARGKSILYTQHVLSLFGPSAATTRPVTLTGKTTHAILAGPVEDFGMSEKSEPGAYGPATGRTVKYKVLGGSSDQY